MTAKTFQRVFGYTDTVIRRKPIRKEGQDLRDLPTYTTPEAAIFLGIPERTLRDWCSGENPIIQASAVIGDIFLLSFRDLVDAHIVQVARKHHKVPMGRIQSAITTARNSGNSAHPLQDDNIRVFARQLMRVEPGKGKRKRTVTNLSRHNQAAMPEVVDLYAKRLTPQQRKKEQRIIKLYRQRVTSDPSGNPVTIYPWRFWEKDAKARPVAINPEVMSGRLVVSGTRIPVSLLQAEILAGTSSSSLARRYGLSERTIRGALSHLDTKRKAA